MYHFGDAANSSDMSNQLICPHCRIVSDNIIPNIDVTINKNMLSALLINKSSLLLFLGFLSLSQ